MRQRMFLSFFISIFALANTVVAATQANWTTLANCQLRSNPANDGDSFHVVCSGREYIFRLYFVDAPETDDSIPKRVEQQAAYFHVTKQSALAVAETAKRFSAASLRGPFIVMTRWQDARGRSRLPRFYAVVRINGRDLGEALVENGLARVYGARTQLPDGATSASERVKLRNLERQAKAARRGAWAYSANAAVVPQRSQPPMPGPAPTAVKTNQTNAATDDPQLVQYRISADGIRHNSRCRYFNGMTTRPCGPTDGRPCKICGG